jgi:hypothetical protein
MVQAGSARGHGNTQYRESSTTPIHRIGVLIRCSSSSSAGDKVSLTHSYGRTPIPMYIDDYEKEEENV